MDVEIVEEIVQRAELDESRGRDFHAEGLAVGRKVDHHPVLPSIAPGRFRTVGPRQMKVRGEGLALSERHLEVWPLHNAWILAYPVGRDYDQEAFLGVRFDDDVPAAAPKRTFDYESAFHHVGFEGGGRLKHFSDVDLREVAF